MTDPILAYNNHFESGTVSASEEDTDFPKENAYDWKAFDWWKPTTASSTTYLTVDMSSATAADFWGIYSYANIDSVTLQGSSDNFSADINDIGSTVNPTDDEIIFRTFTSVSYRYWRLKIVHTSIFSLGVAAVGARVDVNAPLPPGFSPLQRNNKIMGNKTGVGHFLGRSVEREGFVFDINFDLFTNAYMRSTMEAFIDHAETKPFFFSWHQDSYSDEAAFCAMIDKADVDYSTPDRFRMSARFEGVR